MTKYGYNTVGIIAVLVFIVFVLAIFIQNTYIKYGFFVIGGAFLLFTLYFFRDPNRITPDADNLIISPADGKILSIEEVEDTRFLNEKCYKISIFMSPLNVHVNRIPIDGKVDYFKYIQGEYLVAFYDKADERNERTEIGITSKYGKMLFTQVAGFVARRIICNLQKGDSVKVGKRFGMIKFGSRSDVFAPLNWKIKVKVGDYVKGGESILYEYEK